MNDVHPLTDADRRLLDFQARARRSRLEPRWPVVRTWRTFPTPVVWLFAGALFTSALHLAYHWWRGW